MPDPRAIEIAKRLHMLHVSNVGIVLLLSSYQYEEIERQLDWLPYRKAKRPEAFIVEAVRNNYSPPKEFFYAEAETRAPGDANVLYQSAEPPVRQTPSEPQGYGTESGPHPAPQVNRLEP